MKDGMEYAEMLGLGVSSCDVVVKPARKRKRKDVKKQVIEKVNAETAAAEEKETAAAVTAAADTADSADALQETENADTANEKSIKKAKKKFKFDVVYAEGIAVFALVIAILLTNIFWENSGINTVFKNAFNTEKVVEDTRTYLSFNAQSPSSDLSVSVDAGVMTFSGKGSMYPVCDGKVSSVIEEDGKYTVTIEHSDLFTTVISGVDFVYADKGEEVFKYIPVCYLLDGSAKVYMYNGGALVTNYIVENGTIIWES
ncbi:MAG TPA: hypothetical protein DDW54_00745 [Clostridiales bacterium]|nr:hypothetical protein [Clostridiales bacterium]